jgi:hypothetical protein
MANNYRDSLRVRVLKRNMCHKYFFLPSILSKRRKNQGKPSPVQLARLKLGSISEVVPQDEVADESQNRDKKCFLEKFFISILVMFQLFFSKTFNMCFGAKQN